MRRPSTKTVAADPAPDATAVKLASGEHVYTIPGIKTSSIAVLIVGTAPLIMNKFSAKAQQTILDKHVGKAKAVKEIKDPTANYNAARHRLTDGSDGIHAGGVKACLVSACDKNSGLARTVAKGAFRISADDESTNLIRIITPGEPRMREDIVRLPNGMPNIVHRPEYWPWAALIRIECLDGVVSIPQTLAAVQKAGFAGGLGEWRPSSKMSNSGSYGVFRLGSEAEVEAYDRGELFAEVKRPAPKLARAA